MIIEKDNIQPGNVFEIILPSFERVSLYRLISTPEDTLACGIVYNYDSFTVLKVEKRLANIMLYVMVLGRDTPTYGWITIQNYNRTRHPWIKRG